MSRHKSRLQRLTRGLGGASAGEIKQARFDRMTDEEINAEIVQKLVALGFDVAAADPDAAIPWVEEQDRIMAEKAVEAGFDPELAESRPLLAARWYVEQHGRG